MYKCIFTRHPYYSVWWFHVISMFIAKLCTKALDKHLSESLHTIEFDQKGEASNLSIWLISMIAVKDLFAFWLRCLYTIDLVSSSWESFQFGCLWCPFLSLIMLIDVSNVQKETFRHMKPTMFKTKHNTNLGFYDIVVMCYKYDSSQNVQFKMYFILSALLNKWKYFMSLCNTFQIPIYINY